MKKQGILLFIKNAVILLVILFICDRAIGWGLETLFYKQKHGDDFVTLYLLEKAKDDVLVFGGSRASHHFNATMIEDSTHMSCFNGGRDEMTITYTAATLPIACKKYMPKVVILEMLPTELSLSKDVDVTYQRIATVLLPFLHKYPQLKSTIALSPGNDLLKSKLSHIYPYNSTIGSSIQNAFTNLGHKSIKGYEPLDGAIDTVGYTKSMWSNYPDNTLPLNKVAVQKYQQVIQFAKENNIRLITVVSPFYFPFDFNNNVSFATMKRMMKDNGFELYDFSHDPRFLKMPSLFHDDIHLNDSGAAIFTKEIIKIINRPPAADMAKPI